MSTTMIHTSAPMDIFSDAFLKSVAMEHASLSRAHSLGAHAELRASLMEANNGLLAHRRLERAASEPGQPLPPQSPQPPPNASRYKTELCRPYEETGSCKYGDKCQFAHGMRELRNLQRHPKYKTELCKTFHSVGICPYGPRCHFVHAEEARSRPSLPPSPNGSSSLSRSPADSVSSFFPNSPPPSSPRTSPPPSPEEARLPVFNRLATNTMMAFGNMAVV